MRQYCLGEEQAFITLYKRHSGRVRNYLSAKTSSEDSNELTQEVFSRLHSSRDKFNASYPFLPWIFTIARNVCFDFLRKKKSQASLNIDELASTLRQEETSADKESFEEMLRSLPMEQQEMLKLRYQEEWSFAQIAEKLSIKPSSARQIVSRAVKKLRRALGVANDE